jgi:hypothetical protein
MDTRAIADNLGTDPKTLRRFLRDPGTSFTPVGSGGRYSFTQADLAEIRREFEPWQRRQAAKAHAKTPAATMGTRAGTTPARAVLTQLDRDRLVWEEEARVMGGPPVLQDLRDPRVRAQVRAAAQAADDRLTAALLAAGLHVSQMRDRAAA